MRTQLNDWILAIVLTAHCAWNVIAMTSINSFFFFSPARVLLQNEFLFVSDIDNILIALEYLSVESWMTPFVQTLSISQQNLLEFFSILFDPVISVNYGLARESVYFCSQPTCRRTTLPS